MSVHGFAFCPEAFLYDRGVRQCAAFVAFPQSGLCEGIRTLSGRRAAQGVGSQGCHSVDEAGKVSYTQLVSEISSEPDYDAALKAVE